jgi:hypothetical protein
VWDGATLEHERTIDASDVGAVCSLASWDGLLISGHGDGRVVVVWVQNLYRKRWSPQQVSAEKLEDRNYHLLD